MLRGGAGSDALIGGTGTDTADYSTSAAAGIALNLDGSLSAGGDAQGDTLSSIENAIGSAFADAHRHLAGRNAGRRRGRRRAVRALPAVIRCVGGAGDDLLSGGLGADQH